MALLLLVLLASVLSAEANSDDQTRNNSFTFFFFTFYIPIVATKTKVSYEVAISVSYGEPPRHVHKQVSCREHDWAGDICSSIAPNIQWNKMDDTSCRYSCKPCTLPT